MLTTIKAGIGTVMVMLLVMWYATSVHAGSAGRNGVVADMVDQGRSAEQIERYLCGER